MGITGEANQERRVSTDCVEKLARLAAVGNIYIKIAIRYGDGLIPQAPSVGSGSPKEFVPRLRQMAEEAGRDPRSLSVTLGGAPEDLEVLKRNRDLGVARMTVRLPPAKEDKSCPFSTAGRN